MKTSVFIAFALATIVLPHCNGGFGDIVGKAKDVGELGNYF